MVYIHIAFVYFRDEWNCYFNVCFEGTLAYMTAEYLWIFLSNPWFQQTFQFIECCYDSFVRFMACHGLSILRPSWCFIALFLGIYMKCLAISLATWREEPGTQVALRPWRLIFERNFRPTNHRKVKYASGRKSSVVWGTFSIHIYFTRFLRGPLLQKHASRARLSWQLFTFRNPQRGCIWLTQVVKYWAPNTSTKLLSLVSHTSPSRPK